MASEVTKDGRVVAPLNITNPAPLLSLRGFQWDTVDEKIHGPKPSQEDGKDGQDGQDGLQGGLLDDEQSTAEQEALVANFKPSFQRAAGPAALPVPQLPQEPTALPPQLAEQLGHISRLPVPPPPVDFPLAQFQGAYAGNGFNLIWRPRPKNDKTFNPVPTFADAGPDDNILELNLTTEQLTFGASLGKIPNRGLGDQPDINLGGLPYLQTVQDVTNPDTGKGDNPDPTGIHFEPGVWLNVPAANFQTKGPSVVRMASIPHGTTVNAQGLVPTRVKDTALGGFASGPRFEAANSTPIDTKSGTRIENVFKGMDASNQKTFRIPQNLEKFNNKGTGTITTEIIKNPNLVLEKAIQGQNITETIVFTVSTGPDTAVLNGGGTANIAFLAGKQAEVTTAAPGLKDTPNAFAALMTSTFWIETVMYKVNVPRLTAPTTLLLRPTMPSNSTAPTPVFAITTPPNGVPVAKVITVPGIQIQYSQTVNLNFGPPIAPAMITWPHISVATLVPTGPQPFQMT